MDISYDDSSRQEEGSSLILMQSGSGGPRRRYHRKDAKKKIEDPHAPRRPRSAYVHFLSATRAKYGSGKGSVNQREINEQLAAEWRALSEPARQEYINRSNTEKEEYARLMEDYVKTDNYKSFNAKKAQLKRIQKEWSDDEDGLHHKKHRTHGKREIDYTPIEQGIFSEQFVNYNKEQEQSLRNLRRLIAQTEDELDSLKKTSHSLGINSQHVKELIGKDRAEADRLEDTITNWLIIVKNLLNDKELEKMENEELEAYLEDLADHSEENKNITDRLDRALSHTTFLFCQ